MGKEHRERIAGVRKEMMRQGIDIALVFTADEHGSEYIDDHYKLREYLSGFTGSNGSLLINRDSAVLWTDGRYFIQAQEELKDSGIELYKSGLPGVPSIKEYIRKAAEGAHEAGMSLNIGADLKLITVKAYIELTELRDKGVSIRDIGFADLLWKERPERSKNPLYDLPDSISGRGVQDKLSELRKYLKEQETDSVLVSDLGDVMWLFNLRGSDIRYSPVATAYGYVDMYGAYLFADGESVDNGLRDRLNASGIRLREYACLDDQLRWLKKLKIICDFTTLNAHVYELLKENEIIDKPSFHYINKHIKNETEQKLARDWHIEDGLVLTRFIGRIKELVRDAGSGGKSINEYDAAMLLDGMRREIKGNRGLSFETISAYRSNGAIVHYSPADEGSAELRPEGFLLVDSGGQYEGATTDVTRTIALGPLTEEMRLDYTAVLKGVLDLADAVFLEGTRGENLDILARRPIWERYIDYRHGTGHGVGAMLNVHEGPQAFRYKIDTEKHQPALSAGMITSDEPGIYREGEYGIRIENLLLCTRRKSNEWGNFLGFDVLTLVPYEREAIVPEMLTTRQRELINEYHRTIYYLYSPRMSKKEREWLAEATAGI